VGEEADLADRLALPDLGDRAARGLDREAPRDHEVERVRRLALPHQDLAAAQVARLRLGDDRVELVHAQAREGRDHREIFGIEPRDAHGGRRNTRSVVGAYSDPAESEYAPTTFIWRMFLSTNRCPLRRNMRYPPPPCSRKACGVVPVCLRKKRAKCDGSEKVRS